MSELAFNANGDMFDVPSTVAGWRVRRMKKNRGAPELVYDQDGKPLTIPVESDIDDLRAAVKMPGRYRLEAVNADNRLAEGVPPAYVQVVQSEAATDEDAAEAPVTGVAWDSRDETIRESMRLNTSLAKSVIDNFPQMLTAAADLLRAADAAGLPRRAPPVVDAADQDDDDEEEKKEHEKVVKPAAAPAFDLNAVLAQLMSKLLIGIATGEIKIPGLSALLDWRKKQPASPPPPATPPPPTTPPAAQPPDPASSPKTSNGSAAKRRKGTAATASAPAPTPSGDGAASVPTQAATVGDATPGVDSSAASLTSTREAASAAGEASTALAVPSDADAEALLATIDPATMAHFLAIQAELEPEEAALAQAVASDLTPAQLNAWINELSTLSVADAVGRIRRLVRGEGGVS